MNENEDEIDLKSLFITVTKGKWIILAFAIASLGVAALYLSKTAEIFESNALLQVEEKKQGLSSLGDISELFDDNSGLGLESEIEVLKSRSILFPLIEQLNLDIDARVDRSFWASRGQEKLKIEQLEVPESLVSKELILTMLSAKKYQLSYQGEVLLTSEIGLLATDKKKEIKIFVADIQAKKQTQFIVQKLHKLDVYNNIIKTLSISPKSKKGNIIELKLKGSDKQKNVAILNSIVNIYLKKNVEQLSEEAVKSLEFLKKQAPKLKQNLTAAESNFNLFQLKNESVNLTIETQSVLKQTVEIGKAIFELSLKEVALKKKYKAQHPNLQVLTSKKQKLLEQKQKIDKKIGHLPKTQKEILSLKRNLDIASLLYTEMLNRIQELRLVQASTIGNIRVLDYAVVPYKKIAPKEKLILVISLLLGVILGLVFIFIRHALYRGIEDIKLIEDKTHINVYASLLNSDNASKDEVLFNINPNDLTIEALRSLRTNLHFSMLDVDNNIIVITGPSPSVGKSFVSSNLAYILAETDKNVLLIDADMRKGHMHKTLKQEQGNGLSEMIINPDLEHTVKSISNNLSFISCGNYPPNPSELLLHKNFSQILKTLSEKYDIIIIDTPPMLAVTDATIIGNLSGLSLAVLKYGHHHMQEITTMLKRCEQGNVSIKGFIFNMVEQKATKYGGYGYYQYNYDTKAKKSKWSKVKRYLNF
ncbi:Tyrosine-protein kinase Wzc [uncultured Candidatus Thioglobus sp.]|nr:Tyrosine-protein kinase Wzc [uncultured Candidatus Thioglobus sp.]